MKKKTLWLVAAYLVGILVISSDNVEVSGKHAFCKNDIFEKPKVFKSNNAVEEVQELWPMAQFFLSHL